MIPDQAQRDLYQRARPFRFGCYWVMACICLLLLDSSRPWWQPAAAAIYCIAWPPLEWRFTRRFASGAQPRLFGYGGAYSAECFLTGGMLAWASIPPVAGAVAVVALLAGASAQAGHRLLVLALPALGLGVLAGAAAAPLLTGSSTGWVDATAMALMVGFVVSLADLSFRQALRLSDRRRALASHSQTLERLNARLEHYIPQSLRLRLHQMPERRCSWERRWLTVAFVDLVGFTALVEQTDAEVLARVLDEYLEAVAGAAMRHRGELSKLMGDGVLVAFGIIPGVSRQAAAGHCLSFCREIPDILGGLAQGRRCRGELLDLRIRAGIASGYCTLGDWGGNGRLDFTMIGSPVNLASRLQAHAGENGFIADQATAVLAAPDAALGGPEVLEVRGLGQVWVHPSVDHGGRSAMVPASCEDNF